MCSICLEELLYVAAPVIDGNDGAFHVGPCSHAFKLNAVLQMVPEHCTKQTLTTRTVKP